MLGKAEVSRYTRPRYHRRAPSPAVIVMHSHRHGPFEAPLHGPVGRIWPLGGATRKVGYGSGLARLVS